MSALLKMYCQIFKKSQGEEVITVVFMNMTRKDILKLLRKKVGSWVLPKVDNLNLLKGINAFIKLCKDMNLSDDYTVNKLIEDYQLSKDEAVNAVRSINTKTTPTYVHGTYCRVVFL